MEFKISTIENPIGFFEEYFRKDGILKHFEEYKDWCIKEQIAHPEFVRIIILDNDCIIERTGYNYALDDDGNLITDEKIEYVDIDLFSKEVERLLKSEFKKSSDFLKEACKIFLLNYNDVNKLLNFQEILTHEIRQDCVDLFIKFPFCNSYLENLSQYIKDLSNSITMDNKELYSKSFAKEIEEANILIEDPIKGILGYFKGKNEFGQEILSNTAFNKLIESIEKVKKNEDVKLESKFDIKEKIGIVKYTFYVLHLSLFGSVKNDHYYTFLHSSVLQFQSWDYDNFKSKISDPPRYLPNYIPTIIKEQRERQINQRSKK